MEPGRARRVRPDPALLVRPRRRRLPDRRRARDVKDRELRDDPATERTTPHPARWHAPRPLDEPPRGARRSPALAADRGRYDPPRILVGETTCSTPALGGVLRLRHGRAEPRLQLRARPSPSSTPSTCARSSARRRPRCRAEPGPLDRLEPRRGPPSRPVGATGTRRSHARAAPAPDAARHAVLYYGDELALADGDVPPERSSTSPTRRATRGARRCRGRAGGWENPWLPLADTCRNVEDQRADPGSTLHFTRDLIALRRRLPPTCARAGTGAAGTGECVGLAARRAFFVGGEPRHGLGGNRWDRGDDRARDSPWARGRGHSGTAHPGPGGGRRHPPLARVSLVSWA